VIESGFLNRFYLSKSAKGGKMKSMSSLAVVLAASILVFGCGKKADTNKPIAQIQQEVQKMSTGDLQATAQAYVKEIKAKKGDVGKVSEQLKSLSPKELFSDKAKKIRDQAAALSKDISSLTQRYDIYAKKFAEKGGDLTKIKLD
jgi:hypothetical protein